MDIFTSTPFLIGRPPALKPLARFLPPVAEGVLTAWLEASAAPGGWMLDPFGASPQWTVEAARAGQRVLVAANNPVSRFLLEMAASPPGEEVFTAALADLAASRKGEERLEAHLQSLYLTNCVQCNKEIPAQAFLWKRDEKQPYARIYQCPHCEQTGEFPASEQDQARLTHLTSTASLHRSRALERVAPLEDPDREYAEQALDHYQPRPIYALSTLVNRLDSLYTTPERRRALTALLLHALDLGNVLWPHPTERPRPKQLTTPPQFREHNLWIALEQGIGLWTESRPPVPVMLWPEQPPESGGICLFEGPLRELAEHLDEIPVKAIASALPRPNQAFWTLSALWAGWLWGNEAVAPFKSVLRRKRYDWQWHANALGAALRHLDALPVAAPIFAALAEPEPGFLSAALIAGEFAGLDLTGLALRTQHDPAQITWQRGESSEHGDLDIITARKAILDYLTLRDEPVTYLHVHAAGLVSLAAVKGLSPQPQPADSLPLVQAAIRHALEDGGQFQRYEGSENVETGLWALAVPPVESDPLSDRVEMAVVRYLQRNPECAYDEVLAETHRQLPGLVTPSEGLVRAVLDSYATEAEGRWKLRPEDLAAARRSDLDEVRAILERAGASLGYQVEVQETPRLLILWKETGKVVSAYALLASAVIGRTIRQTGLHPERVWLVLPGGRSGLVDYKLRRDPSLKGLIGHGWRFVKYRHLRRMAELPVINRDTWAEQLSSDPIDGLEQQMAMF
jgi:hypothetical protein